GVPARKVEGDPRAEPLARLRRAPRRVARDARARLRTDHQSRLGPRLGRLPLQGGVRGGQARHGRADQGRRAGDGGGEHHLQCDLPRVRTHIPGRGPDRRAGQGAPAAARARDPGGDSGIAAEQALRRGDGVGEARRVPVLGCRALDHRCCAARGRRLDRAMSAGGADTETKRVNLALQGGGAHGAFTWGVLDRLLEDERIEIEGICGTSAGAMNGVAVAHGLEEGGAAGARRTLDRFWYAVAELGRFSPIQRSPIGHALGTWRLDTSPSYLAFDYLTRMLSPYQTN